MNPILAAYMGTLAAYHAHTQPSTRATRKSPQTGVQSPAPYQTAEGMRQVEQADGGLDMFL